MPEQAEDVQAKPGSHGWFSRTIQLSGRVRAIVEFNALGSPWNVRVNGHWARVWQWWALEKAGSPWCYEFNIPSPDGDLYAEIQASGSVLGLRWVRLRIGTVIVYDESSGSRIAAERAALPIPATSPQSEVDRAPIPAAAPGEGCSR